MVMLEGVITQAQFADLVGISQQAVSELVKGGALERGASAGQWLLGYCGRLREQAAGRMGSEDGGLDLVQERAQLAREQRIGQAIKNRVALGEYAPVGVLADVLALASSAVVDRFDQLEGALRKACPELPQAALVTLQTTIAAARNEWIRGASRLVAEHVEAMASTDGDGPDEFDLGNDGP